MGDADNDGVITLADAYQVLLVNSHQAVDPDYILPEHWYIMDVDKNGTVELQDAYLILMYTSYQAIGVILPPPNEVDWTTLTG